MIKTAQRHDSVLAKLILPPNSLVSDSELNVVYFGKFPKYTTVVGL